MNTEEKKQWKRLLTATKEIAELKPWEWMHEEEVFGVQLPDSDDIGFVSIMGEFGEHIAVSAYLGERSYARLCSLYGPQQEANAPEHLYEIRHLMLSFEDREFLKDQDRRIISDLGFKFRGRNAWPLFRSVCPGYFPWQLVDEEVEQLAVVLEQAIDVSLRCKENPALVQFEDAATHLIRTPKKTDDGIEWIDEERTLAPLPPEKLNFELDRRPLFRLANIEKQDGAVEFDLFLAPGAVTPKGERPQCMYLLVGIDAETEFAVGMDTFQALEGLNPMLEQIPAAFVKILMNAEYVPTEIRVQSERLATLLEGVCEEVGIEINLYERLEGIETFREGMSEFF